MKIEELKELVELVSERNISELVLEEEGVKLKIKKLVTAPRAPEAATPHAVPAVAGASSAPEPVAAAAAPSADDGLAHVTSPIVGTFYRQPEPGSEPFVREGQYVKKGQVLCIIEAMKLMNEIESEFEGELVKVLVDNGQPVQYGDPLFAIRES